MTRSKAIRMHSTYKMVFGDDAKEISEPIFEWAYHGDSAQLEKHPALLGIRDRANASPLHHATAGGHVGTMRLIVQMTGVDELNSSDDEGNSPVHWSVLRSQQESLLCLLELGADPNLLNQALMSPLHLAVKLRHNTLVQLLLSHGSTDANLEGDLGNTPVMLACSVDNHEALQILFKHGAKLCQQNKLGHYPVHGAAFAGATRSLQLVLQKAGEMGYATEVHINNVDKSCRSPLHLAVLGGNLEIIRLCIAYGARIDQQQQCDKSTPLHLACIQGATEAVKLMMSTYDGVCDVVNIIDGACQTLLHKATIFDHCELAEYLISKVGGVGTDIMQQGADINFIDCKGHTPLLLATSCGAWRTVSLLLKYGANPNIKDTFGCNILHLAILKPEGLKNILSEVIQLANVQEMLGAEDNEGCTPFLYACRNGVPDSVSHMLGHNVSLDHKSREKKSALHFAAEYGRINTCHKLLDNIADTRLLNEGDERGMTPLHLASRSGHVKVVELLLRRGALFHSDYKGWTCLHHAAAEDYTQTMDTLLASNIKLLDKSDEDGNTALHLASREGSTNAVLLLLSRGAEISLNKADRSFLHEAIFNGRRETTDAIISSDRCTEAMEMFKLYSEDESKRCAVMDLIEFLPESYKTLMDTSLKESEDDVNSYNYSIEYNFKWLQAPVKYMKQSQKDKRIQVKPLVALNFMLKFNRVELLTHPVCKKYLEMKWKAYGVKAHLLNLAVYSLGLLPLTHLIVSLKPNTNTTSTNHTSVTMATTSLDKQCYIITASMFLVLAMSMYGVGKEVVQIFQQGARYFCDVTNMLDWGAVLSSLLFVVPLLMDCKDSWPWEAGALASLVSWINFLCYLQRFEHFGIYVVMFREIAKTLLSIILLFFCLMLAFALSFYALILDKTTFDSLQLVLMQAFVMMAGELNYQDLILTPYMKGQLAFPLLTYVIFIWFVLLMPILLMNLLIGLAVGDIAEVQNNAVLKQIGMQIELHTNLEEKLPYWFMKRVDQPTLIEYPNKASKGKGGIFSLWESDRTTKTRLNPSHQILPLEREIGKVKYRLKEISSVMEKQHNLLKLVIQKMEINSMAEEHDGPQLFQGHRPRAGPGPRGHLQPATNRSLWDPVRQAMSDRK